MAKHKRFFFKCRFGHFYKYAPIKIEYAIDRFAMEAKRQMDVLDKHLGEGDRKYVCGDEYTIADMAIYPWVKCIVDERGYNAAIFLQVHTGVIQSPLLTNIDPCVK